MKNLSIDQIKAKMVSGEITATEYIKYKNQLDHEVSNAYKKSDKLKKQIRKLNEKSGEKEIKPHYIHRAMAAGYVAGAVAGGFIAGGDFGSHLLGSIIGAEAGLTAGCLGGLIYHFEPVSKAVRTARVKHKAMKLNTQNEKIRDGRKRIDEISKTAYDIKISQPDERTIDD